MNVKKLNQEIEKRKVFIYDIVLPDLLLTYAVHENLNTGNSLSKKTSSIRNILYESKNIKQD